MTAVPPDYKAEKLQEVKENREAETDYSYVSW